MYKQGKFYAIGATGFLYSLIIVDLYRKLEGSNVEIVRNVVYVFFFGLLLVDMLRTRKFRKMSLIAFFVLLLFGYSVILNPGYSQVYVASIFLFISRLWPAYYIGRYTQNWEMVSKCILLFSPISLAYAICLFVVPNISGGDAYATIASNLVFVSLISLLASFLYKKMWGLPIAITCLVPVFFYGTRAFFLGVIISLFLAYVINSNRVSQGKRIFLLSTLIFVGILFLAAGDTIFDQLYQWFPDSRTLKMMATGDMMDDSNRSLFYDRICSHLNEEPLEMLGLIGDRIYLSPSYATTQVILSQFSHNCCLELCMDFGVPVGLFLNFVFFRRLLLALKSSFVVQNSINYIYVMVLGASFVNMMVSASFMGDYAIWLLFGLAYAIKVKRN